MELPSQFVSNMKELLGDDFSSYELSFQKKNHSGLRINTMKVSVDTFLERSPFSIHKVPWISNGFYYGEEDTPSKHPYYYAGLYYLQEPSAMTPANVLPVEEGDHVLDLCGAPGGKATELGAKLNGTGFLLANDISNSRAGAMLKNLELFGISNMFVTSENPEKLAVCYPHYFDKILVDAPCSGEGMFRKDHSLIKSWENHGPEYYAPIQTEIMESAVSMLRPGGMLLYSTCTFSELEDEKIILGVLQRHSDMSLIPIPNRYEGFHEGRCGLKDCVRIYPHEICGEGHFLALLQKREENGYERKKRVNRNKRDKLCKEAQEMLYEFGISCDTQNVMLRDENIYLLPEEAEPIRGIRYLRTGLLAGKEKKGHFEPSQAIAMSKYALSYPHRLTLSVQDDRLLRYLKGETITIESGETDQQKGYVLVCVEDYPLGFGKVMNGCMLKNKYQSGWRMV